MIITKTPFRMSFFGGGTDFLDFYNEHGGAVLSVTEEFINTINNEIRMGSISRFNEYGRSIFLEKHSYSYSERLFKQLFEKIFEDIRTGGSVIK